MEYEYKISFLSSTDLFVEQNEIYYISTNIHIMDVVDSILLPDGQVIDIFSRNIEDKSSFAIIGYDKFGGYNIHDNQTLYDISEYENLISLYPNHRWDMLSKVCVNGKVIP